MKATLMCSLKENLTTSVRELKGLLASRWRVISWEARHRTSATDLNLIRLEVEHSNMGVSEEVEGSWSDTWRDPGEDSARFRSRGLLSEVEEVFFRALFFGLGVPGRPASISLKEHCIFTAWNML